MGRILVTGGSGFIGSHVVEALLAQGRQVICLLRQDQDRTWLKGLDIIPVQGDLADLDSLGRALQGVEAICHLAGETKGPGFHQVNARGAANLVQAVRTHCPGLKKLVYLSSMAAQGPGLGRRPLAETDLEQPISAYGRSKLAGEKALAALNSGTEVTVLRPPAVYGPRDDKTLILVRSAGRGFMPLVRGVDQRVSLLHVADLVQAVVSALEKPGIGGTFLLSDGETYRTRDLAQILGRLLKTRVRPLALPRGLVGLAALACDGWSGLSGSRSIFGWDKYLELREENWTADCSLAQETLGFSPRIKAEQGFEQTIGWYRERGWIKNEAYSTRPR